jgi:quinol monooxygenase YgiN
VWVSAASGETLSGDIAPFGSAPQRPGEPGATKRLTSPKIILIGKAEMSVRLIVSITAAAGKGGELAAAYRGRCREVMEEPGCEQFEVFQSVLDPDKLVLLERWADQAALDVHGKRNQTRTPLPEGLRAGAGEREDYQYNRTR